VGGEKELGEIRSYSYGTGVWMLQDHVNLIQSSPKTQWDAGNITWFVVNILGVYSTPELLKTDVAKLSCLRF
jgi:hypothetical protein